MSIARQFANLLFAVFSCNHARALATEGKTFCPDCGRGIVYRWVVLRCEGCHRRLESRYRFRQIEPMHCFCISCGEYGYRCEVLENPEFFQLQQALLLAEKEPLELDLWHSWHILWTNSRKYLQQIGCQPLTSSGALPSLPS